MTKTEQMQATIMRENGYSYGQIANELEISINTIRSFCQRKHLEIKDHKDVHFCKSCGVQLDKTRRKFCSRKCKTDWWNHHKPETKGQTEKVCPTCGKTFRFFPSQKRIFCSHPCYIKQKFSGLNSASE